MKARPTQSRKGVKGGLRPFSSAPCRVKGQRPLWGLGQRPNCFAGDYSQGSRQQRRRQRSVPASNFARPQTRPQAALPPRFREAPVFLLCLVFEKRRASLSTCSAFDLSLADYTNSILKHGIEHSRFFVPAKLSEARRTGGTRERNEAKPGRKRCCANDML